MVMSLNALIISNREKINLTDLVKTLLEAKENVIESDERTKQSLRTARKHSTSFNQRLDGISTNRRSKQLNSGSDG